MNWLQVQLLIYTHPVSAVLHVNRHKHTHTDPVKNRDCNSCSPKTNTDCFVHGSAAELVHTQLGVVFLFEFLILCLGLELYFKRNPNSAIVYPHERRPTSPAV